MEIHSRTILSLEIQLSFLSHLPERTVLTTLDDRGRLSNSSCLTPLRDIVDSRDTKGSISTETFSSNENLVD